MSDFCGHVLLKTVGQGICSISYSLREDCASYFTVDFNYVIKKRKSGEAFTYKESQSMHCFSTVN